MAAWLDGVLFTPTLGGTTDWVVSAAVIGYNTPALAGAAAIKYKYHAQSADQSQWEDGEGTYVIGSTTLPRTTVLYNSSGTGTGPGQSGAGTKINFTTVPTVSVVALKEDMISVEEANNFTAAQKSQLRANMDVLKFNYIINGAMMVSQDVGTTAVTTTGTFPVDMFAGEISMGGTFSMAQVASLSPGGSPNRLRFTVTAADASVGVGDLVSITTKIEGLRIADLKLGTGSAKTVIVQFGVKGPAGTYCVVLMNGTANRSYVAEYVIAAGEANTDVVKNVIIPLDQSGTWVSNNTVGMFLRFGLMAGSSFQQAAGSWGTLNAIGSSNQFNIMGTNGNVFELFDVGLYEGTAAPSFKVPDYISEFDLCLRYYYKLISNGITLAQMSAYSTTLGTGGVIPFPRPMRTAPTMSFGPGVTDFGILVPGGGVAACSAVSTNGTTVNYADIRGTVAAVMIAGQAVNFVGQNTNARLNFDARL